jgi:putative hydrolase of the HAD superfamily
MKKSGKPDKQIFEIALNKFGAGKESVIMIGNSIDTDIAGAGASGIKTVWLNRNNNIHCEHTIKPDYIIKNLKELASLL